MLRAVFCELGHLPRRMGGASGVLIFALAVLALGVLLPLRLGRDFMDVQVWLAYACLSMLVLGPVVAESVAGEGERASMPADAGAQRDLLVARIAAGALYGWSFTLLILALGAATVSLSIDPPLPPPIISFDIAVFSLCLSLFAASAAAAVSMGARNAKHAKRTLRQAFLLLLVIAIYYSRFMPRDWKHRLTAPSTATSFTEGVIVVSLTLLVLGAGLLKLALGRAQDTEIRLNL